MGFFDDDRITCNECKYLSQQGACLVAEKRGRNRKEAKGLFPCGKYKPIPTTKKRCEFFARRDDAKKTDRCG
jgi:hypothetical protein